MINSANHPDFAAAVRAVADRSTRTSDDVRDLRERLAIDDFADRWATVRLDGKPCATLEARRVYDREAPKYRLFATDGAELAAFNLYPTRFDIARALRRADRAPAEPVAETPRDTRHTVARSVGAAFETKRPRTRVGAANAFVDAAFDLISANGARDTAHGWAVHRRALRIARDIEAGNVTAASLDAFGGRVTFIAGRA